jgi:hypothetical protein
VAARIMVRWCQSRIIPAARRSNALSFATASTCGTLDRPPRAVLTPEASLDLR